MVTTFTEVAGEVDLVGRCVAQNMRICVAQGFVAGAMSVVVEAEVEGEVNRTTKEYPA